MTIRGGGNPHTAMAAMPLGEWTRRLGALLAEAYDCFMVGTLHGSTEYKRGSRAIARGQWQAPPRIIAWQTTRSRAVCRRARVGQGQAFGGAEEAPSLTLAARDGDGQYAVGAEECSRRGSNKRINKQGRDKMVCTTLDKESPIQAVCPNWARTDLCGGRGVTRVPTANVMAFVVSPAARWITGTVLSDGRRRDEVGLTVEEPNPLSSAGHRIVLDVGKG